MSSRAVAAHLVDAVPKLVRLMTLIGFVVILLVPATAARTAAQEDDEADPALLLIMDSSGSMNASDGGGGTKIQAAKKALNGVVNALPADSLVGLRVYGHRIPNTDQRRGCKDTELISPVGPLDRSGMRQQIRSFDAKGFTPIGLSLQKGARDLPSEGERTIVLVSDGIDTCAPPPPCEVAKRLSQQGVELRIDTVGFQVDPRARRELQCIARVAKGSYVDAGSSAELSDRLAQLSLRALRKFEASGTAVTGGSSTAGAPALESGQFTDTISPGEELYYGVELGEGQAVGAAASSVGEIAFLGTLYLTLTNPEDQFITDDAAVAGGEQLQSIAVQSETIGPDATDPDIQAGGTYYLRLTLDAEGDESEEYPIELVVDVTGEAAEPTPTEEPAPDDDDSDVAAPEDTPGSSNTVMLAIGGVAFGLLGAALGALAGRKVGAR
ncbi:MAG TPA: VWA domain-containing protein [Actinomycetota bacterium]|nr:VWA domain-containing protein [Actinomycetota bacterium]